MKNPLTPKSHRDGNPKFGSLSALNTNPVIESPLARKNEPGLHDVEANNQSVEREPTKLKSSTLFEKEVNVLSLS